MSVKQISCGKDTNKRAKYKPKTVFLFVFSNILFNFASMKLQANNHTTHHIIQGMTVLMLYFLCTLSSYSNDKLPQLEVKQRKGNMLVKLHNYSDTTSLVCLIQGSGNHPFPYHPAISSNLISTERNEQIQTLSSYN